MTDGIYTLSLSLVPLSVCSILWSTLIQTDSIENEISLLSLDVLGWVFTSWFNLRGVALYGSIFEGVAAIQEPKSLLAPYCSLANYGGVKLALPISIYHWPQLKHNLLLPLWHKTRRIIPDGNVACWAIRQLPLFPQLSLSFASLAWGIYKILLK